MEKFLDESNPTTLIYCPGEHNFPHHLRTKETSASSLNEVGWLWRQKRLLSRRHRFALLTAGLRIGWGGEIWQVLMHNFAPVVFP